MPDYCAEHVPVHKSFTDEESLKLLLAEVATRDTALQDLLDSASRIASERVAHLDSDSIQEEEGGDTFEEPGVQQTPPHPGLQRYQDFVSSFLSLFLQSESFHSCQGNGPPLEYDPSDPSDLMQALASRQSCPNVRLFRRAAINPNLLTSAIPDEDNPGYTENGVVINQLARLLDVAVLQFLSTVTEHADVHSIEWALDYMKNLLIALGTCMNSLNSFGWYGAPHIRIRKGTTVGGRKSVTYPLAPPVINPPPPRVVVVTPPMSPAISPDLPTTPDEPAAVAAAAREEKRDPVTGQISPQQPIHIRSLRGPEYVPGGEGGRGAEMQIPSLISSPRSLSPTSPSPSSPNPPPPPRKRKHTPASMPSSPLVLPRLPCISMGSIQEEDAQGEEEEGREVAVGRAQHHMMSSVAQMFTGSMESIPEFEKGGEEGEGEGPFAMDPVDDVEMDYFESIREELSPPIVPPPIVPPDRHTPPRDLVPFSPPQGGPWHPKEDAFPPPMFSPPGGHGARNTSSKTPPPPPVPKNIPEVDVELELETLLSGEGRISLLALLHAISKFPQNQEIWKAVGEKCFSLIQLCMDVGMPPQKDDPTLPRPSPSPTPQGSGQERRSRFSKQDNSAFNKLATEKPWQVHNRHVIKFSIDALIQCGVSSITGCTSDYSFCRLQQFHVAPPQGSSLHSRLIRNMRRIHAHSPAAFREALIAFSQPSTTSCRRMFRFLHVMLQYCMHGDVYYNHLLASVVVAVLSVVVDRLVQLDITEQSIQDVS